MILLLKSVGKYTTVFIYDKYYLKKNENIFQVAEVVFSMNVFPFFICDKF